MTIWIALWYSVVVTKERRVSSADLLSIASAQGLAEPRTVLSTGNLIFTANGRRADLEARLERETHRQLGREINVFCRTAAEWRRLVSENPFPAESALQPAEVAVRVMRQMPGPELLERMAAAALPEQRFAATPSGLWLYSPKELPPGRLLSAVGSAWAGEGTFRSASSIGKVAAALG